MEPTINGFWQVAPQEDLNSLTAELGRTQVARMEARRARHKQHLTRHGVKIIMQLAVSYLASMFVLELFVRGLVVFYTMNELTGRIDTARAIQACVTPLLALLIAFVWVVTSTRQLNQRLAAADQANPEDAAYRLAILDLTQRIANLRNS